MNSFYIYTAHLSKQNYNGITTSSSSGYLVSDSENEVRNSVRQSCRSHMASYKVDGITIYPVTLEDLKLAIGKME